MRAKSCVVQGCEKPQRYTSRGWCLMHYARHRRNGHLERTVGVDGVKRVKDGYIHVRMPAHPLAVGGWVAEHRMVAYDAHDPAVPTRCHWCWTPMKEWNKVHVDHLDYDKTNNALGNLVPSCLTCNSSRHPEADMDVWVASAARRRVLHTYAAEVEAQAEAVRRLLHPC